MKKGFTLIELLGVIILLGIIGTIAVPSITNLIKDSKQKVYDSQVLMIERTAKDWATENLERLSETEIIYLSLEELINNGYIEQTELRNPLNKNKIMNGCIVINYDNEYSKYQYKYADDPCDN
ncbi:MAG: prepilin-type N-terminal cleavage/methylation domain-containing protein [Bacilli bacterium]|nr:prepilin-type N-terminal cleavage/methylation domain-containing protein [Bacilli bacterium]MDD4608159.1 prepilin-type N-terminal cleavage/methylation domain-containing protein [Bacilli bacterium]